ncbi:fibronectin-like [Corticium candelabrum]|uniref:fibronectin-like n=1 Tax=Corticium candelabrum TaxID=121492 RepID=UPI002E254215|nr:fibronectin-like [Corticium candelabrum]
MPGFKASLLINCLLLAVLLLPALLAAKVPVHCDSSQFPSVNVTCGGTASDAACAFPFTYNNKAYCQCTSTDHDQPWCATRTGDYSVHQKWGNCRCSEEVVSANITCGGNSYGAACSFPFIYNGDKYYGCTSVDHDQPWCATQEGLYSTHEKWGNCLCCEKPTPVTVTCDGNGHNAACIFPFKYNNSVYYTCTMYDHNQPWCVTHKGKGDNSLKWGDCNCPHTPESVQKTCDGSDEKANCVFPFVYKESTYYTCTNVGHNQPWCYTEKEDPDHTEWANCYCPIEDAYEAVPRTCGGTANNAACVFPFTYNGQSYSHCISIDHDQPWCGTKSGQVDEHKEWGNCKCTSVPSTCSGNSNGRPCQFPFTYNDVTYYDCISTDNSEPWCATQSGRYEDHEHYGYCKCSEVVKTCKGTGKENPCVFPFLDDGMKFYSCTLNNYDQLWCATEEGDYTTHEKWGHCKCSQDDFGSGSGSGSASDTETGSGTIGKCN